MKPFKEFINEKQKSGGDEAYEKFFNKKLKAAGYDSIEDIPKDKKDDFFDRINREWQADNED